MCPLLGDLLIEAREKRKQRDDDGDEDERKKKRERIDSDTFLIQRYRKFVDMLERGDVRSVLLQSKVVDVYLLIQNYNSAALVFERLDNRDIFDWLKLRNVIAKSARYSSKKHYYTDLMAMFGDDDVLQNMPVDLIINPDSKFNKIRTKFETTYNDASTLYGLIKPIFTKKVIIALLIAVSAAYNAYLNATVYTI
jgi:hypothetical protein